MNSSTFYVPRNGKYRIRIERHVSLILLFLLIGVSAFAEMPGGLKHNLLKKAAAENLLRNPQPRISRVQPAASITNANRTLPATVQPNAPKSIAVGLKLLFIVPIRLHQKVITHQDGDTCTFRPSCSHYGAEAIRRHGLRGLLMTSDRLLRCHNGNHKYYPVFKGAAYDPVPQ
ncbi:MAG: membrane protein insertion efficiency factor YidD [Candidatus Poribacteria bacterium]|nr:membrane protein insertion efficiency factor YidD [Candidatus Poribacteria bacterium]